MIDKNLLPVPLEYTYPTIMKIKLNQFKNWLIYIPEINKFVSETGLNKKLISLGIFPDYWKIRWIDKTPSNMLSGEDWVNLVLEKVYSKKLFYTKLYIDFQLKRNPFYVCDFFCISEDIIDLYYKTRIANNKIIYNYDFSLIPKFIKFRESKFDLNVLENNPVNNSLIGIWTTDYNHFIGQENDNYILGRIRTFKYLEKNKYTKNKFIEKAIELYGDKYDYSNIEFKSYSEEVKNIYCKDCKCYFNIYPNNFLSSKRGCPYCGRKRGHLLNSLSKDEFLNRCINLFGTDTFDYSESEYINYHTPIKIKDLRTNEYFYQTPANHLSRGRGNQLDKDSSGERLVRSWIMKNNIDLISVRQKEKVTIYGISKSFFPDFQILYKNSIIWIEYNGIQHYEYNSRLHHNDIRQFNNQLIRDILIKEYCKENNIIFVEIPYTYNTYKKVKQLLDQIIKDGKDINTIIDYSKLYKL